ncbi:hypothetical protein STVIR_2677 [Streptomyces viridochromogenes Tue57]|uniref:Uncharacterized protein n=1 Tax=Streptomyces viridochromogenes Tue57 TaxID=1160705 RepID=L8PIV7_STRVR|nr:hypothetical protein STVIR_2677 [Streptomyces viridochromogenes Tue57]
MRPLLPHTRAGDPRFVPPVIPVDPRPHSPTAPGAHSPSAMRPCPPSAVRPRPPLHRSPAPAPHRSPASAHPGPTPFLTFAQPSPALARPRPPSPALAHLRSPASPARDHRPRPALIFRAALRVAVVTWQS